MFNPYKTKNMKRVPRSTECALVQKQHLLMYKWPHSEPDLPCDEK